MVAQSSERRIHETPSNIGFAAFILVFAGVVSRVVSVLVIVAPRDLPTSYVARVLRVCSKDSDEI